MTKFSYMKKVLLESKQTRALSWIAIVSLFIGAAFSLQPLILSRTLEYSQDRYLFIALVVISAFLHLSARLLSEFRWFWLAKSESEIIKCLKINFISKVLKAESEFFNLNSATYIDNKLSRLESATLNILRNSFFYILPTLFSLLVVLITVFALFDITYFVAIILSILAYTVIIYRGSKILDRSYSSYLKINDNFKSKLVSFLTNRSLVSNFNFETQLLKNIEIQQTQVNESFIDSSNKRGIYGLIQSSSILILILSIFFISSFQLFEEKISVSNFLLLNLFSLQIIVPLESLSKIFREVKIAFVEINECLEFIHQAKSMNFGLEKLNLQNFKTIEFINVSAKYPFSDKFSLEDVSFKIQRGQVIGIIGKSGSGKTTLLKLITREIPKHSGRIIIDGIDIENISKISLGKLFTCAMQNNKILPMTILENIKISNLNASLEDVKSACKKINILGEIEQLPENFETQISANNQLFSEGQLQRISIARCMLKKTPLVLLDEPTSALDKINESLIIESFKKFFKGKSVILTTHRLKLLELADVVLVFDKGRLIKSDDKSILKDLSLQNIYKAVK